MNRYQFQKISKQLAKQCGSIKPGNENAYNTMFFAIEGNLIRAMQTCDDLKDSELINAVYLSLHQLNDYMNGTETDVSAFETDNNLKLKHATLMAVDPFTNEEIKAVLVFDLSDRDKLKQLFTMPVRVLNRLLPSIDFWNQQRGIHGYINYLNETFGTLIKDDAMEFSVYADPELTDVKGNQDKLVEDHA